MKKDNASIMLMFLLLPLILLTACQRQTAANPSEKEEPVADQIGEYIVEIYEDKKGRIWFGTLSKGVACYDPNAKGKELVYYTIEDDLAGNTVVDVAEDQNGDLWFATHTGLSKWNPDGEPGKGNSFITYHGLNNQRISLIFFDNKNNFWLGTWAGVYLFDGEHFSKFPLPEPNVEIPIYQETTNWVTEIMEDKEGNIWFSRSGFGVCKYNTQAATSPASFTQYTKKDGLASNCVQSMKMDKYGNIWFGSRVAENDHPEVEQRKGDGGLSIFDGEKFLPIPDLKGLNKNDLYSIFKDKSENMWVSPIRTGIYRFDLKDSQEMLSNYTFFNETNRPNLLENFAVQSVLEDRQGRFWFGCSGGLFRLEGSALSAEKAQLINITQHGPW